MDLFSNNPGLMVAGSQYPNKVRGLKKDHQNGNGGEVCNGTLCGGEAIDSSTLHGGEAIENGTLHCSELIEGGALSAPTFSPATYRTRDGQAYFKFRYVQVGGYLEIDILEMPQRGAHRHDGTFLHTLVSARGGEKICISSGYEPRTIEKAKNLSMEYAELVWECFKTGVALDEQVRRRSRPLAKAQKRGAGFLNWLFN